MSPFERWNHALDKIAGLPDPTASTQARARGALPPLVHAVPAELEDCPDADDFIRDPDRAEAERYAAECAREERLHPEEWR